jgi:hypothetical protein
MSLLNSNEAANVAAGSYFASTDLAGDCFSDLLLPAEWWPTVAGAKFAVTVRRG